MKKQFAVLGLGSFGWSVAVTLEKMGCDVIAVDDSYERIQEISDQVAYAMKADISEPEALKTLGSRNLDGVVISVSANFEASVMAAMICKEMGIPKVLAKAKDRLQGAILERVGADIVVYPEIDMGSRVAKNLVSTEFTDWIALSGDYSMVEAAVPAGWAGKSLVELRVRENYGINVVGLIRGEEVMVSLDPNMPLPEEGILILIGANKVLEKFDPKKR